MNNRKKFAKNLFYGLLMAVFVYLIIALKIFTFKQWDIVFVYSICITTFMLSRVLGSFFYKPFSKSNNERGNNRGKFLFSSLTFPLSFRNLVKMKRSKFEPNVSFIIPCKNEEKSIYKTIKSCVTVDYPKNKLEVIAINDGSTDNTLNEMLRAKKDFPKCKISVVNFKENKGKRHGMEYGFRHALGEIVIQLDSDSFPRKNSLKRLVEPFIDEKVGATVGHTLPANASKNTLTKMQEAYYFMSFRALKATESIFDMVFCCSGCFSAYRREYVLPILEQWLDEKFLGKKVTFGDDRALTNWMIRQGYKTVYVAGAEATTVVPEKLRQFLKQQTRWKKGWFINSMRIWRTVVKKDKFVAFTYFLPLILITLITPIIAFKALILNPLVFGISPVFYIMGILLVSLLFYAHYNYFSTGKYGRYMLLWSILNMTILSYILVYALYDLRNMSWGTR